MTIKVSDEKDGFYFHSNVNPWKDAAKWVQVYGEDTAEEYAVLGDWLSRNCPVEAYTGGCSGSCI